MSGNNPLTSSFTFRIAHAAAFGAAFSIIILGSGVMQNRSINPCVIDNPFATTTVVFISCLLATTVILLISHVKRATPEVTVLAIMGPNGVGKTTLLRCLNLILKPTAGTILVEEQDLMHMTKRDIAKRLGYVPQRQDSGRMTAFDVSSSGEGHILPGISLSEIRNITRMHSVSVIMTMHDLNLALRFLDKFIFLNPG